MHETAAYRQPATMEGGLLDRPDRPFQGSPQREPLVSVAIRDCVKGTEALSIAIEALESRLTPVLSVTPRGGVQAKAEGPRPALPSLVEALNELRDRVTAAERRLNELAARVEV